MRFFINDAFFNNFLVIKKISFHNFYVKLIFWNFRKKKISLEMVYFMI